MKEIKENERTLTEVDCALIMMLDEERDLFIQQNKHLIIEEQNDSGFVEFTFFDKAGKKRSGVMCSGGQNMGNTEACALFYKLSRKYKAHLYINLGVAGYFSDIDIGDVVIVSRISTLGENNATNSKWQLKDGPDLDDISKTIKTSLKKAYGETFQSSSQERRNEFCDRLIRHPQFKKEEMSALLQHGPNKICQGWCITVPEVIKGDLKNDRFPDIRKAKIVDMEAYYLSAWHEMVKMEEPDHIADKSDFLIFKSVSDMADENKALVEECGSRTLAMANLCDVVCAYLTDVHDFQRETDETIFSYFKSEISSLSLDPLPSQPPSEDEKVSFGKLCSHFLTTDPGSPMTLADDSVAAACDFLSVPKRTLLLTGHSGTGKSTFISYVFDTVSRERAAVLIDFSKFSGKTVPTDNQVVYLLERLLSEEKSIAVFLDGVNINCKMYDALLGAIQGRTYANLSLCIGDITDDGLYSSDADARDPNDLLPPNTSIVSCSFSGLSVCCPQLESMLQDAETYFRSIDKEFNAYEISAYIQKSGLSHVDFRLLKMFADHGNQLAVKRNFFNFIDWYCAQKVQRKVHSQLYSHIPFNLHLNRDLGEEQKAAYKLLRRNSYTRAFLFANCVANIIIKNNDKEKIFELLKSDYLLSDDMNLFLGILLNSKDNGDKFAECLLPYLSDPEISLSPSAQTQLIYSIFQITKLHSRPLENQRKELLRTQVNLAKNCCEKYRASGEDYYDWSLQYRTLSILMWNGVEESKRDRSFLDEYNRLLLNDPDTRRYNLAFHLYYYSQKEFTFSQVNTFETNAVTDEMFFNTYYRLLHSLDTKNSSGKIARQDPFICMNIITFAHLIQDVLIQSDRFSFLATSAIQLIEDLKSVIQCWDRISCYAEDTLQTLCTGIAALLDTTLDGLKNSQSS